MIPAGTWMADPVHSDVSFRARHLGVGRVRGTFALDSATLVVGADGSARVTAVVDATSVRTGNDQRDQHVLSADFLDVAAHPTMAFTSTGLSDVDSETFVLAGELTVHGVTRPVALATEFHGTGPDPSGTERVGFSATTTISRAEFGVDIQLAFGAGNIVVADVVEVFVEVAFTRAGDAG